MLSIASSSLSFLPPSSLVASSSKAAHIQMKASEFAYGLPGGDNILGEFDPAGFMEGGAGFPSNLRHSLAPASQQPAGVIGRWGPAFAL